VWQKPRNARNFMENFRRMIVNCKMPCLPVRIAFTAPFQRFAVYVGEITDNKYTTRPPHTYVAYDTCVYVMMWVSFVRGGCDELVRGVPWGLGCVY
jgi:hypothetical protein